MEDRIDINEVMKHEYFAGTDFENLPTFEESLSAVTESEKYLQDLGGQLQQRMEK